jgi:hypothetical protein
VILLFSHFIGLFVNCSIFSTRLEHPIQHAVPEHLRVDDKTFHQWQCEYDSFLTTLTDLKSEEEAPEMM